VDKIVCIQYSVNRCKPQNFNEKSKKRLVFCFVTWYDLKAVNIKTVIMQRWNKPEQERGERA